MDSSLQDWDNIFAVNVTGIYLAWKHAVKWMVTNNARGTLLPTTSVASLNAYPGFPMYAESKAAGNGLTRAVALDLGKYGIRANATARRHP